MKIAAIGDLHINVWDKNDEIYKYLEETFDHFTNFCIDNNVDKIIMFGDLFHTKVMTSTEGLIHVVNEIDSLSKICPIYIIVGNHDIALSNDSEISLPNIFKNKINVKVIDKYYKDTDSSDDCFHFLPYMKDKQLVDFLKDLSEDLIDTCNHYLFSHFGVNGFVMNLYNKDEDIKALTDTRSLTSPTHLRKFKHVYLGHYHSYQSKENITYIGSPIELKHGEEYGEHGFLLIDTEKEDKFFKNEFTPKHITLELKKSNMELIKSIKKDGGYYIRLIIPTKMNKEKIIKLKDGLLKKNFDVQIIYNKADDHQIAMVDGWDDFIEEDAESIITKFAETNMEIFQKNNWDKDEMLNIVLKA